MDATLTEDADDAWRARLLEQIDALDRDRRQVAWLGDLPPAIEASFAPFRAEFEASYDPPTNCFELPMDQREVGGTVQ